LARALPEGTVLHGRYRVTELVAQGGMGAVYRAGDLRLSGRECALKEIICQDDGLVDPTDARAQFYREASTLGRLDHPNLPKVSDHFSEGDRDYLVMDYVPGADLQSLLDDALREGHRLSEKQVLEWARQLFDALEYLHAQDPPVLHRDIKPANIRLTASGVVKLVDFGLVKLMEPEQTRTITVLQGRGTASYTPLEQYGGETGHTDTRADIYALGATLYHLLTGHSPPPAKDRFLRPDSLTPAQELNPAISSRTDAVIGWALAMHPDDRPPNISHFRNALLGRGRLPRPSPWRVALKAHQSLAVAVLLLLLLAATLSYWPVAPAP